MLCKSSIPAWSFSLKDKIIQKAQHITNRLMSKLSSQHKKIKFGFKPNFSIKPNERSPGGKYGHFNENSFRYVLRHPFARHRNPVFKIAHRKNLKGGSEEVIQKYFFP